MTALEVQIISRREETFKITKKYYFIILSLKLHYFVSAFVKASVSHDSKPIFEYHHSKEHYRRYEPISFIYLQQYHLISILPGFSPRLRTASLREQRGVESTFKQVCIESVRDLSQVRQKRCPMIRTA